MLQGVKLTFDPTSHLKNHRSWKMNQSRKMLEAAFAAEVDCQTNLTGLLYLEFWFFWLKQMTFRAFFSLNNLERTSGLLWVPVGIPESWHYCGFQMRKVCLTKLWTEEIEDCCPNWGCIFFTLLFSFIYSFLHSFNIYRVPIMCQFCDGSWW